MPPPTMRTEIPVSFSRSMADFDVVLTADSLREVVDGCFTWFLDDFDVDVARVLSDVYIVYSVTD